jgi:hypothetical protein
MRCVLVTHDGVVGKASEDCFYIVRVARIDVALNTFGKVSRHCLQEKLGY